MAVLTYSEIETKILDYLVANVSTDAPLTSGVTNEIGRFTNDAYRIVREISGGRIRKAPSSVLWTGAQLNTGTLVGDVTDIAKLLHVYATTQAPIAVTTCGTTNGSADITHGSAGFLAAIVAGWHVSGTGIPSNTLVDYKTSTGAMTLTSNATATGSVTLTFSPTDGPIEPEKVELARIQWLRAQGGTGATYAAPIMYAAVRGASPGGTDVNKTVLEYYPGTTGYYFPAHYDPQMVPLDATITTPDVNDVESADIAFLAARMLVHHVNRADLADGLTLMLSEGTRLGLERREKAMLDAAQDR